MKRLSRDNHYLLDAAHQQASPLLSRLYAQLRGWFPQALWQGDPTRWEIALTFDDGPHPRDTEQLLEVLAQHKVKATFFNVGTHVKQRPELTRATAAAGHQIGLHGYYHRPFPLIPPQILQAQLDNFRQLAAHIYHLPPEQLRAVRPPYGLFTPAILRRLHRWGYRPVMWSLVPHHRMQSVTATLAEVSHQVGPGAILVLHEGWAGPPVATLAGLIITQLQEAGFKFVTIDQMWQAYFAAEDGSP